MDKEKLVDMITQTTNAVALVFTLVSKYAQSIKNPPKGSVELRNELLLISDLLEALELKSQFPTAPEALEGLGHLVENLGVIINKMQGELLSQRKYRSIGWPFTSKENEVFLSNLESFKSSPILLANIEEGYASH